MVHPSRLVAEGRFAVVTNVGRDAVDADVPTDERRLSRTAKSCGPGAPRQASSLADLTIRKVNGGNKRFTGEITYKP